MATIDNPMIQVKDLNLKYGDKQALFGVNLDIPGKQVTAFIGPSGCGKTTLLRCFNRLNDLIDNVTITGTIRLAGSDINDPQVNVSELRKRVGMVFQKSNPFPKSIYDNVAYGPRLYGIWTSRLEGIVEKSLRSAALWDEVKDRLTASAMALSGGQQQRLCVARTIAPRPEVILLDEPTASLDPQGTQRIEELLYTLKREFTIVIVTHNMQQAARVSDTTSFFYMGDLVETGATRQLFTSPTREATEAYITGRFG